MTFFPSNVAILRKIMMSRPAMTSGPTCLLLLRQGINGTNASTRNLSLFSCSSQIFNIGQQQQKRKPLLKLLTNQYLYTATSTPAYSPRLIHSGGNDGNIERREQSLPPLMTFPPIVWPRFMNAIRNWFFITFIIKPYFDKEFSMNDFILGAKEVTAALPLAMQFNHFKIKTHDLILFVLFRRLLSSPINFRKENLTIWRVSLIPQL